MTTSSLTDRLAALPTLTSIPRAQLEWFAAHGQIQRFDAGQVLYSRASPPTGCYVVLSGQISVRVARDGMSRAVYTQGAGDMGGRLPFSRMPTTGEDTPRAASDLLSVADEPVEILVIAATDVREMTRECYDLTAHCVHIMIDRTRLFKSDDLQREKMASLGRLAAGLAHELNNPSSAAARSARLIDACRQEVVTATRTLCAAGLTDGQLAAIEALEARSMPEPVPQTPLEAAEREEQIIDWLEARRIDPELAEALASASITAADLEAMASVFSADCLSAAVTYLAAHTALSRLTRDVEHATRRIDLLVSAVKRHTHMDRALVVDAVDVLSMLADTLTLAEAKARDKTISLALQVEPGLPPVAGVAGQLNDVWMNLIDNALDSTPTGGHIMVSARRRDDTILVCVTDTGHGIPEEDQARVFEPFFTTKPVGQGAGLGLDVVQRVVRSHGGLVELSSQPGHTEFRVTLPLATSGSVEG